MFTASSQPPGPTVQQIYERLHAVVTERLDLTPEQISSLAPDLPVVEGLQLDSLAQVTLIAGIEDEFHIQLELADRQSITTIADLVKLIQDRGNGN